MGLSARRPRCRSRRTVVEVRAASFICSKGSTSTMSSKPRNRWNSSVGISGGTSSRSMALARPSTMCPARSRLALLRILSIRLCTCLCTSLAIPPPAAADDDDDAWIGKVSSVFASARRVMSSIVSTSLSTTSNLSASNLSTSASTLSSVCCWSRTTSVAERRERTCRASGLRLTGRSSKQLSAATTVAWFTEASSAKRTISALHH